MEIPASNLKRIVEMLDDGFYMLPRWVARETKITAAAKLVYANLWTRKNGDNVAWPGQKLIATNTGLSERSVRDALNQLVKHKMVKVVRRGLGKTNEYELAGLGENLGIKSGKRVRKS